MPTCQAHFVPQDDYKEYQESCWGQSAIGRPARKAGNLTAICDSIVWNSGLQPGVRVPSAVSENLLHQSQRNTGTAGTLTQL
jgi:hypothetical protein